MPKRNIEIDDNLQEILESAKQDVSDLLEQWLDENHDAGDGEPESPELGNDLDYSGSVHQIIDSSVPIYTSEINDLWFLYGPQFEEAFDNAGFEREGDWPMGWQAAAIYCYIEQEIGEWYSNEADDLTKQWWSNNRAAVVAVRDHERGE